MDFKDIDTMNKTQLDEILNELRDWANEELANKGYLTGDEVNFKIQEAISSHRFICPDEAGKEEILEFL